MRKYIFAFFMVVFCTPFAFSNGKAEPFQKKALSTFTLEELKHAQYYLDSALILTRVIPYGESKTVESGTLTVRNGEKVEQIQISKNTGGELLSLKDDIVGICFSEFSDRILYFTKELIGSEYVLSAKSNKVKYGNYEYTVNRKPKLLYLFSEQFIRDKTREKEKGRQVN